MVRRGGLSGPPVLAVIALLLTVRASAAQSTEVTPQIHQRASEAALGINASLVEAGLPDTPFLRWLKETAGPGAKVVIGGGIPCDGVPADKALPTDVAAPFSLCAQASAVRPDQRTVSVALAATVVRMAGRPDVWVARAARLASAYVIAGPVGRRANDSLDVLRLRDLPRALELPRDRWPHADLRIKERDIRIKPRSFKPGSRITVSVKIRNAGDEPARVSVYMMAVPDCSDIGGGLGPPVEGTIGVNEEKTFQADVKAPNLRGWSLHVTADVLAVSQTIRKYNAGDTRPGNARHVGRYPKPRCVAG